MKYCSVNGIQQSYIDVDNRGLAYGDGLFTTAKIVNGQVEYLNAHINRLLDGCNKLDINGPKKELLKQKLITVATNYSLAVLKVIIIANSGGRGYARTEENTYELIVTVHDYPLNYNAQLNIGVKLGLSKQKIGINPMLAGLKHLNRLEQVLLRRELSVRIEDDLLVTNIFDEVVEATSANLFLYIDGALYTPDVSQSGVNGIMRQTILANHHDAIIQPITLDMLLQAQAMFICNCVMGIMPAASFDGRKLSMTLPLNLRKKMDNDKLDEVCDYD